MLENFSNDEIEFIFSMQISIIFSLFFIPYFKRIKTHDPTLDFYCVSSIFFGIITVIILRPLLLLPSVFIIGLSRYFSGWKKIIIIYFGKK